MFQGCGIEGVLQESPRMKADVHSTPLLEQHPKQREILPKKKLHRVAPSPLCISQSW